jgi:hypothetical protein
MDTPAKENDRVDTWTPDGESIVEHVAGEKTARWKRGIIPQWHE